MRIAHYLNQFFAGFGGEDVAGMEPTVIQGATGPGNLLASLLGEEHEVVVTIACGDDYAASNPEVAGRVVELAREAGAEAVVAGPAFSSGRYGLASGRVAAAAHGAGLPAVAAMHPDNPGLDEAGAAPVIAAGAAAKEMKTSLERLAPAFAKLAAGQPLSTDDGRVGRIPRTPRLVDENAADRAVSLLLRRLDGDRQATEIPPTDFDVVTPAGPVEKTAGATVALLTEGALVPAGNPDRLPSARATQWLRYDFAGVDTLESGSWESVDGGFSTVWTNADPNRMVPVDVARELEESGDIGQLHESFLVTVGNGTAVANAKRFGVEWAAELRAAGVQAVILTGT